MHWSFFRRLVILPAIAVASNFLAPLANAEGGKIPETAATEGAIQPYIYPQMDASKTLTGKTLLDALRKGGYVLYMRHTETGTVTADCNASNLTPRGERDAARVGAALKSLAIPFERIASSPVCRVQDTARHLGLGAFDAIEDLSNTPRPGFDVHAAREKLLAIAPASGKNVLLVSHTQAGNTPSQPISLDYGEIVVFAPDGNGTAAPIARVKVDEWAVLISKYAGQFERTTK